MELKWLVRVSAMTGIISGVLQQRAAKAANRAIFWHNSNFAR